MRIAFGPYAPDLPALVAGPKQVLAATNCLPRKIGYGPANSLSTSGMPTGSLSAFCRGAISGISRSGVPYHFAGDATKLYGYWPDSGSPFDPVVTDLSKSGDYAVATGDGWKFATLGDTVVALTRNEPMQYWALGSSTAFADLSEDAPRASCIATVGLFLVVGNTVDDREGAIPERVQWHAIDNPFSWPRPGTLAAIEVQSDYNTLKSSGGWVQNIVSEIEIGAIFQESAVSRMDYRGGSEIFAIDEVEDEHGLLIPNLVVPYGREVFYLSESGFRVFDYSGSRSIGNEIIDRTFFADIDRDYDHRVSAARDPDNPYIYIGYAGSGNTAGQPNKILVLNHLMGTFAVLEVDHDWICKTIDTVASNLDATDAEDIDSASGSFDDRLSPFGAIAIGGYTSSQTLAQFGGAALAATLETGDLEFMPGRKARTGEIRPLLEGGDPRIAVGYRAKPNGAIKWKPATRMSTRRGTCPSRCHSRYHRIRMTVSGGFDSIVGVDVEAQPGGR
jgi:hypothetical protein